MLRPEFLSFRPELAGLRDGKALERHWGRQETVPAIVEIVRTERLQKE